MPINLNDNDARWLIEVLDVYRIYCRDLAGDAKAPEISDSYGGEIIRANAMIEYFEHKLKRR